MLEAWSVFESLTFFSGRPPVVDNGLPPDTSLLYLGSGSGITP